MSDYFLLRLQHVNNQAEEWLSHAAFAHGALGMSEALEFDQPEGEEDVFTRIPTVRTLDVYFATAPEREFLDQLQASFPFVRPSLSAEAERDWLAEWKKGFVPFALVGDHWIVPSWCERPRAAKQQILIDPGMAFGTGTHETTQLVAEALKRVGKNARSALDVGTGTGILAVLARQLGIDRVVATELEADSRRVARETFRANHVNEIELDERQIEDLHEQFDVVMANIIDGVLVRLQDELIARVRPGGWLLLSGIIAEREPDFISGMRIKNWEIKTAKGDWRLYGTRIQK